MDNMSSSRTRRRRSSQNGKFNSSEEDSPVHSKLNDTTNIDKKVSTTSTVPVSPSRKFNSKTRENGKGNNRDSEIVLDVNSILDQLMDDGFDEGPPKLRGKPKSPTPKTPTRVEEKSTKPSRRDEVKSPIKKTPDVKNEIKKSPLHSKFGEELPIYNIRGRRSRNNDSISEASSLPTSPWKQTTPTSVTKDDEPKSAYKISIEEEEQMNLIGNASKSRRRESVLSNGHGDEESDRFDGSPKHVTSKTATGGRDRLKARAFQEFNQDSAEDKMNKRKTVSGDGPLARSASIGRSGSFKNRQQMDGDKALGECAYSIRGKKVPIRLPVYAKLRKNLSL